MAKPPSPEAAMFRPMVFEGDYAKIGRELQKENPGPTPDLFEFPPEPPEVVGERAYTMNRDRLEHLARQAEGGNLSRSPWDRVDAPLAPGQEEIRDQRAAELRALHGGLPDAPGEAQATEAGNRLMARFR